MQEITRRAALKGTAAVAAVAVPIVPAMAATDDAYLVALYRRWRTQSKDLSDYLHTTTDDVSDKEYDALCQPLTDMEREIMTTPAQSIQGVAVKFRVHVHMNYAPAPWLHEPLDQLSYDRADIAAIYRDLERLVREG